MTLGTITLITVPVTDQDRAKTFYVDTLGFSVTFDYVMDEATAGGAGGGARWVMLTPPGGGPDITLATWFGEQAPPGSAKLTITAGDVDATYADMAARGARPHGAPVDAPWGRFFTLDDPDGNTWLIVQG
ncbi:MAG TPA: VOC family protein [Pilimelia sp.]|nr:VOC family protein [Pilimelia sp.]